MQRTITSSQLLQLKVEAFKRGIFDFIVERKGKRHLKQEKALEILTNDTIQEFLYGGAAGGAKSWTGCCWLAFMCMIYPDTKWFIARNELKRITESTLITFYKVAKEYGFLHKFKFNAQKNFILFDNGSRIDLLDAKYMPSDPMYERFGSLEFTGGWIEEAPECKFQAFEILKTRIGRNLNDKYNITPKILLTANPNKNWTFMEFYKKHINKTLDKIRFFLQSLVTENPFIESTYIDNLKRIKDKATKERLLKGNWDYADDPNDLCDYDSIMAIFENDHVEKTGTKYITCDVARFGSDKARVAVWDGWVIIEQHEFAISATTEIQNCINTMRIKHQVSKDHTIADEDGVGGGVVDNCGILGFTNNASPIKQLVPSTNNHHKLEQPQYKNLQVQCIYYLADKINKREVYIQCSLSSTQIEDISEELGQMKADNKDVRKLAVITKEDVKDNIGRSPDWRDLMLMRSFFDLKPKRKKAFGTMQR